MQHIIKNFKVLKESVHILTLLFKQF